MGIVTKDSGWRLGDRIREYREQKGLGLTQLATAAEISKSYLWSLEDGSSVSKPSADVLYRIAEVLGVTMSDLLGKPLLIEPPEKIPASLQEFAKERNLPQGDVRMLANIRFRGEAPSTKERWEYIYNAIRTSAVLEKHGGSKNRRQSMASEGTQGRRTKR
jgi:transcriptional regulator with XRE-family HTH domain